MARRCAAAAANQSYTGPGKTHCIIREVIRSSHIKEAIGDACWQTRVGLRCKQKGTCPFVVAKRHARLDHFLQDIEGSSWPHAAIGSHYINTQIVEYCRNPGSRLP